MRYQFFAGESFVRLYHTFIWMEKSLDPGANRIAVRLRPAVVERGVVRVGLSDYTADATQSGFGPGTDLVAYQDTAEHYAIHQDEREIATGKQLGGWISVEGDDGTLPQSWQELAGPVIPADDAPLLFRFSPVALSSIRLRMQPGSSAPTAAVLYTGALTVLQRRIYVGHTPITMGRVAKITNARSESGNFLRREVL